jgi:phosphate transport system substrate-binding protein
VWRRLATPGPDSTKRESRALPRHRSFARLSAAAAAAAAAASMAAVAPAGATAATLTGAGSTLLAPLESDWNTGWQSATGNSVSYAPVGSAAGITDISQRSVDFGASDAPMTAAQQTACNGCVQIPWALSATAVGFHLNGISTVKLSGKVLAEIYLGQITNWDNGQIKALNKGVKLPSKKISVIYRGDGSGDTYAFTRFLSDVSHTWASKYSYGTTVSFPVGVSAKGNGGVTALLTNTDGGIAYVAASYLLSFGGLGAVAVENAAGNFEYPNLKNITSAAASVTSIPSDNAVPIIDPPRSAKIAYPISTFTYVIVPQNTSKAPLLKSWIAYALTTGQEFGSKLDFPPVPAVVLARDQSALASLT